MSGRNNRIVRNRDRSSDFGDNVGILKIVIIVIVVAFILLSLFGMVWSFKNRNGNKVIDFTETNHLSYEYFLLSSNEQMGVIDKKGNIVIEPIYEDVRIPNPEKPVFICSTEGETAVLNEKGEKIFTEYEGIEEIKPLNENSYEVERNALKYKKENQYGLIDLAGKQITDVMYDEVSSLQDRPGRILVKKDNQYGILDNNGNMVVDLKYDSISADGYYSVDTAYENMGYIVSKKTKNGVNFGYINPVGEIVLDVKYESIERALEYSDKTPYLIVMQNGKKGVFKNKKKMIDCNYQKIYYSELSKVFIVNKNGKYGFYKLDGKVILKPEYSSYSIAGNYISVEKDGEKKLFDVNGNPVGNVDYTKMIETANPAYFIAEDENGYYSIISKDVNIDEKYVQVEYAFDDYFMITDESGKTGVINAAKNSVEIEPMYDFIILIEGTKSLQAIDGMNNTIDIYSHKLEKTITLEDGIVENLENGYSIVYSEKDMEYINSDGEIVKNTEVYPNKKVYATKQDEKWGFADGSGKIVIPCEYDIVTEFNQYGFAGIKKDGKWGVANENGEIVVEPQYELDTYYFPQFIGKYLLNQFETVYCEEILGGQGSV